MPEKLDFFQKQTLVLPFWPYHVSGNSDHYVKAFPFNCQLTKILAGGVFVLS